MDFTKIVKEDLDSPCQELSNGGLGIVVAVMDFPEIIIFVCFYWGSNPAGGRTHLLTT